ncbi:hypothetical protein [Salinibacter ruber]|uniref:hypothetical protein n=1 Tax=Salinibacter ruber TaxID=146919 RepID=UPI00216A81A4|nr:hypothetical protein [Salinibacter ruber]
MSLVTDAIVNRNLVRGSFEEPEDTVKVQTLGDVSVENYNGSLPTPQDIQSDEDTIEAEHKRAFAFKAPADDSASEVADLFAQEGIAELRREAQKYVLGLYGGAQLQVDYDPAGDDIREVIGKAATKMDNAEAPEAGRALVLPPGVINDIEDDLISRDTELGDGAVQNGYQGDYKGFRLYKAPRNHFTETGTSPAYLHGMGTIPTSIAYEDAVLNVRRIPSTDFSGDQVDGLHVGGGQLIRDEQTLDFRVQVG